MRDPSYSFTAIADFAGEPRRVGIMKINDRLSAQDDKSAELEAGEAAVQPASGAGRALEFITIGRASGKRLRLYRKIPLLGATAAEAGGRLEDATPSLD